MSNNQSKFVIWQEVKRILSTNKFRAIQIILSTLLASWLLFITTIALVCETPFPTWFQERFSNGWGPYQIGFVGILFFFFSFIAIDLYRWWEVAIKAQSSMSGTRPVSFLKRIMGESDLTIFDGAFITITIWGIFWQLVWGRPWQLMDLSSIDWGNLKAVLWLGSFIWIVSFAYILTRLVLWWRVKYQDFISREKGEVVTYADDRALKWGDHDLIGRDSIVSQILKDVHDFRRDGSRVIGVTGAWGIGKTTIINFALGQLEKEPGVLIVQLSPWYFSDAEGNGLGGILQEFFGSLDSAIQSYFFRPDITRLIRRYYKILAMAASLSNAKSIAEGLDTLFGENPKSLRSVKERLARKLENLPVTIVVVIDDIDRLRPEEIPFVFKLVHLCADFKNIVYILAFEREYIEPAANQRHVGYLDKIIQLELRVPPPYPDTLAKVLWNHLRPATTLFGLDLEQDIEFKKKWGLISDSIVQGALTNIRHIKVFVNRYIFVLSVLQITEINPFDLFCIELLRFKYPDLYHDIWQYADLLTVDRRRTGTELGNSKERLISRLSKKQFPEISSEDSNLIRVLLEALFGVTTDFDLFDGYWGKDRSLSFEQVDVSDCLERRLIRHSRYLPRYFYYAVQNGVISNHAWAEFTRKVNHIPSGELRVFFQDTLTQHRANKQSVIWLDEMRFFVTPHLNTDRILPFLNTIIEQWEDFYEASAHTPGVEASTAMYLIEDVARQVFWEGLDSEVVDLFQRTKTIDLLPTLLQACEVSLFVPGSNRMDEKKAIVDRVEQICRDRIAQYMQASSPVFEEPHYQYTHHALFRFGTEQAVVAFIHTALDQNPLGLLRLLRLHFAGNGLQYKRLLQYDPQKLVAIASRIPQTETISTEDRILLDALQEGWRCQEDHEFVAEYVDHRRSEDQCRQYTPGNVIIGPTDAFPEFLRAYMTENTFQYKHATERRDPAKNIVLADRLASRPDLSDNDRWVIRAYRIGWAYQQKNGVAPETVEERRGAFICHPKHPFTDTPKD